MTVQEKILSFPGLSDFPEIHLEAILRSRNLDVATDVGVVDDTIVNLAIADTLVFAVNMPDVTENKLSLKYPRDYFISTARMLYATNGEVEKANSFVKKINIPRGSATDIW